MEIPSIESNTLVKLPLLALEVSGQSSFLYVFQTVAKVSDATLLGFNRLVHLSDLIVFPAGVLVHVRLILSDIHSSHVVVFGDELFLEVAEAFVVSHVETFN